MLAQERKKLPIGVNDFGKLIREGYYFVDKTEMIADLLDGLVRVTLFTRPQHFGKTLITSMLKNFLEIGADPSLFEGLAISKDKELCQKHMGRYPVVSLSFEGVCADTFEEAKRQLGSLLSDMAHSFEFLQDSTALSEWEKRDFCELLDPNMGEMTIYTSLRNFVHMLWEHYGQEVIVLVDEYDGMMQSALHGCYYDEMVYLIHGMLGCALKSDLPILFSVLTGCVWMCPGTPGFNNICFRSMSDAGYSDCFGFTDEEVRELLEYYGLGGHQEEVKAWYGGYRFRNAQMYCPREVLHYVDLLLADPGAKPRNFWVQSGPYDALAELRRLLKEDDWVRRDLKFLVDGYDLSKSCQYLFTYMDLYNSMYANLGFGPPQMRQPSLNISEDNIWNFLYLTGYMVLPGETHGYFITMDVPNLEIREVFARLLEDNSSPDV